jgi:hypothetical protein
MCKPRRKIRAQEKCMERPHRIITDNDILYLIGCEICMQIAKLSSWIKTVMKGQIWEFAVCYFYLAVSCTFPAFHFSCEVYTYGLPQNILPYDTLPLNPDCNSDPNPNLNSNPDPNPNRKLEVEANCEMSQDMRPWGKMSWG